MRILLVLIITSFSCFSQKETYKWCFGSYEGLDFSTNPPTPFLDSIYSGEGCASISDTAGNLLFYTNGETIWNKSHLVMEIGLFGDWNVTQSCLIIKQPGSNNYIVFTQDDGVPLQYYGLNYSVVDMNLASGNGSVTAKNIPLHVSGTEKLCAVSHCNGIDSWVVIHDWNSNNFLSYLVSAGGVSTVPVISSVGPVYTSTITNSAVSIIGQMKISPDGKKLALAKYHLGSFELYDFDNSTGVVSNSLILASGLVTHSVVSNIIRGGSYGCEFSPDGSKLYGMACSEIQFYTSGSLYQWDLCAGSPGAIINSKYLVHTDTIIKGSLQLAPNGKIYIAGYAQTYLSAIDNPNALGGACNYVNHSITLLTHTFSPQYWATSWYGLPNFSSSYFRPRASVFSYSPASCAALSFNLPAPIQVQSCAVPKFTVTNQTWYINNTVSNLSNPSYTFPAGGTYTVSLVLNYDCNKDSLTQVVTVIKDPPVLTVSGNTLLCKGETATLTASGTNTYHWSLGSASSSVVISPTSSIIYTLTGVSNTNVCMASRVVSVTVSPCLGIEEFNDGFKVYPNPANLFLTIESTGVIVCIYNELGESMIQEICLPGKHTLDIHSLLNGVYTLRIDSRSLRIVKIN